MVIVKGFFRLTVVSINDDYVVIIYLGQMQKVKTIKYESKNDVWEVESL